MPGNPLNRDEIASLIASEFPLLQGYVSLETQLQPNGFDLSLRDVSVFETQGAIGFADTDRVLAATNLLNYADDGWIDLAPGPYLVTFNEVVNLPLDIMALGRPRSSLLRSGVSLHTAVWDAGYRGRSQSLLAVHHAGTGSGCSATRGWRSWCSSASALLHRRATRAATRGRVVGGRPLASR